LYRENPIATIGVTSLVLVIPLALCATFCCCCFRSPKRANRPAVRAPALPGGTHGEKLEVATDEGKSNEVGKSAPDYTEPGAVDESPLRDQEIQSPSPDRAARSEWLRKTAGPMPCDAKHFVAALSSILEHFQAKKGPCHVNVVFVQSPVLISCRQKRMSSCATIHPQKAAPSLRDHCRSSNETT
jgi:hypothetical protein